MRYPNLTHTPVQRAYPRTVQCRRRGHPLRTVASYLRETSSKTRRSSRPDLTVGLEAIYHHLPLGLVLPEVPEELFLLGLFSPILSRHPSTQPSTYLSSSAKPR